jgi:hypothetical protein
MRLSPTPARRTAARPAQLKPLKKLVQDGGPAGC